MRDLRTLNRLRDRQHELDFAGHEGGAGAGVFRVPLPPNGEAIATVIASTGEGWDHVSVSLPDRCPTWEEMEHIKRLFFRESELAMQLHVQPRHHISRHPYCLHLWRPQYQAIPTPPVELV